MPRFALRSSGLLLTALVAASALGACAKSDARPAAGPATTSAGEVASARATGAPTDSVSTRADLGRIRGAESAKVWLIEVSDFQCPYCRQWHHQVYATIDREYVQTGKVRMAYLNFPLSMHLNAAAASEAAMCASVQGRFWEVHNALFENQERWAELSGPMALFESLAVGAGVEPGAWRRCMTSHATRALIAADQDRARRSGVASTPSFFVGDRAFAGALPVDSFRVALDAAIAKANGTR